MSARGYDVVLADPPWPFRAWRGGSSRTADAHYRTMSLEDIKLFVHPASRGGPTRAGVPIAERARLFLWAPASMIYEARSVLEAWGFRYKTIAFVWVKLGGTAPRGTEPAVAYDGNLHRVHFGMGHYTRQQTELALLGVRGDGGHRPEDRAVPQLVFAPVGRHSEKPAEVHERLERLYPRARRLELFARRRRRGWTCRGDEL